VSTTKARASSSRTEMKQRTCVVLAGGLGMRLREFTGGLVPKVLAPVNGEPFLAHKLRSLEAMGVTRAVLLIGELGEQVEEFVRRHMTTLKVDCVADGPSLLGTGGSIARALSKLPERFWVTYGDSLMWTDLEVAERRREELSLDAVVTVYHNQNQLQPSNMLVEDELLVRYSKTARDERFQWIDLGLLNFAAAAFTPFSNGNSVDLVDVLAPLVAKRRVLAWSESGRFFDIGTPESLLATQEWLRQRG